LADREVYSGRGWLGDFPTWDELMSDRPADDRSPDSEPEDLFEMVDPETLEHSHEGDICLACFWKGANWGWGMSEIGFQTKADS